MAFGLAGAAKKNAVTLGPEWLACKHAFYNRPGAMIFLGTKSMQMMFSNLDVSFWRLLLSANPAFNESSAAGGKAAPKIYHWQQIGQYHLAMFKAFRSK